MWISATQIILRTLVRLNIFIKKIRKKCFLHAVQKSKHLHVQHLRYQEPAIVTPTVQENGKAKNFCNDVNLGWRSFK